MPATHPQVQSATAKGAVQDAVYRDGSAVAPWQPSRRTLALAGAASLPLLPLLSTPPACAAEGGSSANGGDKTVVSAQLKPNSRDVSNIADPSKCSSDAALAGATLPLSQCREDVFSFAFPCGWTRVPNLDPAYGAAWQYPRV